MATRRITTLEKTHLDQDELINEPRSDTSPAVPGHVIAKLLGFTLAMVTLPIGSYFLTVDSIFGGGLAALMANAVLIGYVVVAFKEDQGERAEEKKKAS